MKISVVVAGPAPNQHFLQETLESVLTQDYNDFQCVLTNPGQIDRPLTRLHLVQGSGLEAGISAAQGDLVAFLTPGDILMPGALAAMAEALESQPCFPGWYSDQLRLDDHGIIIGEQREQGLTLQQHLRREGPSVSSLFCLRREALEQLGQGLTDSYEVWLKAAREAPLFHCAVPYAACRVGRPEAEGYLRTTLDFLASYPSLQDRQSLANVYFWAGILSDRTSWKRMRYVARLAPYVHRGLLFSSRPSRALLLIAERWWPVSQLHQSLRLYFETNPYKGKHYSVVAPDLLA